MKVLHINSVNGIGSTGRIVLDLHKVLLSENHESYIAYGRPNPQPYADSYYIGNKMSLGWHYIVTRLFDLHGYASRRATKKLVHYIERISPDIIHLHNLHGYYINVKILFEYIKKKNYKIIWTLHDCWTFTGHCSYFEEIGCEKWKYQCSECPQKSIYPASWIKDNSKNNYLTKKTYFSSIKNLIIVTPSEWLANLVRQSFLGHYEIVTINNGINTEIFKPIKSNFREKYNLTGKFMILGVASYWTSRKGFEHFIKMAELLEETCAVVLVGVSKKQIKSLPNNIIGIQKTNNVAELVEIYSAADVFVNPTIDDNFPTTNLESIACETPVITFNSGGSKETITSSTGILTEEKSTEALIKKVMDVLNKQRDFNFDKKEKLDKSVMYDNYMNLYKKFTRGKRYD